MSDALTRDAKKRRPTLGIICCTRMIGSDQAQAVMNRYVVQALRLADAAALLIPSLPDLVAAHEVAPRLDGLLLTGSPSNIEPRRYAEGSGGDAPGPFDPQRDAMTAALIAEFVELGRPIFGICRGLQELNVAFGGTLRRDVSIPEASIRHHAPDDVAFEQLFSHRHEVELVPDGVLARATGRTNLEVNSVHYQGIDRLGEGLRPEALAPDGLIEAVSAAPNGAPILAVQWHPEWSTDDDSKSERFFQLLGSALRGEPVAKI